MKITSKIEQQDTDLGTTRRHLENLTVSSDFDLLYLVNGDAGEIAADIWERRRIDKKLIVLSKSEKVTAAVKKGIVSGQIIQRNTLWGELAVIRLNQLLAGEKIAPYENTGMYEINPINLPIYEKYNS